MIEVDSTRRRGRGISSSVPPTVCTPHMRMRTGAITIRDGETLGQAFQAILPE